MYDPQGKANQSAFLYSEAESHWGYGDTVQLIILYILDPHL